MSTLHLLRKQALFNTSFRRGGYQLHSPFDWYRWHFDFWTIFKSLINHSLLHFAKQVRCKHLKLLKQRVPYTSFTHYRGGNWGTDTFNTFFPFTQQNVKNRSPLDVSCTSSYRAWCTTLPKKIYLQVMHSFSSGAHWGCSNSSPSPLISAVSHWSLCSLSG